MSEATLMCPACGGPLISGEIADTGLKHCSRCMRPWWSAETAWATAEIGRLRAELAAAKAEPPRPAVIIQVYAGSLHAFEDANDACKFEATTRIESGYARMRVQSWTWHPKSP